MGVQEKMQRVLDRVVAEGKERGVQLAAYVDGKLLVDAWAGVADPATGKKVDGDTLFPVFSSTKGMAATLAHILVERGLISYETPLAKVWRGFEAHGKATITLRHALSHSAGLPCMPMGIGYREMNDWSTMCRLVAAKPPEWPAGSQIIYHAVTYSWLVGEPLVRVSGKSFAQLLENEICRPLGIKDIYAGIPNDVEDRVAILDEIFETPPTFPDDTTPQSVPGWMQPLHTMMNRADARRSCIPASNGIMSARAMARHYAALLPGGVDGIELLPQSRIREATQVQKPTGWREGDPSSGKSLGYGIGSELSPLSFGHGGYGGSVAFADPEHRVAVGFTKNLYSKNGATGEIMRELKTALGL